MIKYTRLAKNKDLSSIMEIIEQAKQFLKQSGSTQWQSGYPNAKTIQNDLNNHNGLVFICNGTIAAYAAVIKGIEPSYINIDGAWQNNEDRYATIHRICFSAKFQGQGLAKLFLSNIITLEYANGIKNIRVDTHRLNKPMQNVALHNGFKYRGIIKVDDELDPERYAYELNLI